MWLTHRHIKQIDSELMENIKSAVICQQGNVYNIIQN